MKPKPTRPLSPQDLIPDNPRTSVAARIAQARDWPNVSTNVYCHAVQLISRTGFLYAVNSANRKIDRFYALCNDGSILLIQGHPNPELNSGPPRLSEIAGPHANLLRQRLLPTAACAIQAGFRADSGPDPLKINPGLPLIQSQLLYRIQHQLN